MSIQIDKRAAIALRSLDNTNKTKLENAIEHLSSIPINDLYLSPKIKKIPLNNIYILRTGMQYLILFTIQNENITIVDVVRSDRMYRLSDYTETM